MELAPALLEHWMRQYYFDTTIDIGSSGVESFSMPELRKLLGIRQKDLDQVTFLGPSSSDLHPCQVQNLLLCIPFRNVATMKSTAYTGSYALFQQSIPPTFSSARQMLQALSGHPHASLARSKFHVSEDSFRCTKLFWSGTTGSYLASAWQYLDGGGIRI